MTKPVIIDPTITPTQFCTGILKPERHGGLWVFTVYEERAAPDGVVEWVVMFRMAIEDARARAVVQLVMETMHEGSGNGGCPPFH